MVKAKKTLKIPKDTWNKEFNDEKEHPITIRNRLQDLMGESSGCVEAQLKVVDDTFLIDPDNVVVEFTVGSDNGCDLCFLKKTIEDYHKEQCANCEWGAGSEICPICTIGTGEALKKITGELKPKKEPAVYLVTDMGKDGVPEIIWFARTHDEAVSVIARHERPYHLEIEYSDASWFRHMLEEGWL